MVEGGSKVTHAQLEHLYMSFSQVDVVRRQSFAGKLVRKILLHGCYQSRASADKLDVSPHLDTKM